MKVIIAYVFPAIGLHRYGPAARAFADSYMNVPPGEADHELKVIVNGVMPGPAHQKFFDPLVPEFIYNDNIGKDIGAFQRAAVTWPCDLLVCFGAHITFAKPGWLDYMVKTYESFGPALYGNYGFHQPAPHIRTTNFWLPPQFLQAYPYRVQDSQRYDFEHGPNSIVKTVNGFGYPAYQLTWSGLFVMPDWHYLTDRNEIMFFDQHTPGP